MNCLLYTPLTSVRVWFRRRRSSAQARSWASDMEALPSLSRERWPASVLKLVEGMESRAAAALEERYGTVPVYLRGIGDAWTC